MQMLKRRSLSTITIFGSMDTILRRSYQKKKVDMSYYGTLMSDNDFNVQKRLTLRSGSPPL
ncbi:unnamed protein product [Acanthoscelides obtectus]|uniref:Uncharacterized protein n=1 Tax=Acanthoscelides obtectus TaxID=200917 RepID=A0A9P0PNT4_ACAOB|nr:unnamed protein product [Acanthoscelides obtectus]CAK1677743.1 hypothetical protein AOBTE_LOCUS31528 [Acanthoscelides obtectus]